MSNNYDELVAAFLLTELRCELDGEVTSMVVQLRRVLTREEATHLFGCESTEVQPSEWEWDCRCYSDITRDDVFATDTVAFCEHGYSVAVRFYSYYEAPPLIERLAAFESTWECRVEDD